MANSKAFIERKLGYLVEIFPHIKCMYDRQENSHIIEIKPTELFLTDKIYLDIEHKIYSEFLNKFPNEGLSFISEEKTFILKPILTILGKEFKE